MKTAIVYYSKHHANTKKILDAIAKKNNITLIDVTENIEYDLNSFDTIGFASGIYFGSFNKNLIEFAVKNMPDNKNSFLIYTYGAKGPGYTDSIKKVLHMHKADILGEFGCKGYDTFGPFKIVGGIAKGHPDETDINKAVEFYNNFVNKKERF